MENQSGEDQMSVRHISQQDFLQVGVNQIGYIRQIELEGNNIFGVFGADGTQILVSDTYASAVGAMHQNDLHPVSVN